VPKSRSRKPKKTTSPRRATGDPGRQAVRRLAAARYHDAKQMLGTLLASDRIPGESLVAMLLPTLWVLKSAERGDRANACVDACLTLRYGYGQLGIRADLQFVDLVVQDSAGNTIMHGNPQPTWDGTELDGHCILWLPGSRRFVDPTVAQYPAVAQMALGPIVGRLQAATGPQGKVTAITQGQAVPPGTHFGVPRKDGMLLYTIAEQDAAAAAHSSPFFARYASEHRRTGTNLASYALEALRAPSAIQRARTAPYPRLVALLDAIGDSPSSTDDDGNWFFDLPDPGGGTQALSLDDIPLPRGAPPALL
jgi:hypothetical protein